MSASGFVVPPREHPRGRYEVRTRQIETGPGYWNRLEVTVVESATDTAPERVVGTYERGLAAMYATFEPFRQLREGVWHDYALISADYTHLSVMDLRTGEIVATEQPSERAVERARDLIARNPEKHEGRDPVAFARAWGFCPTEFYVPDWWDSQDGSIAPGSRHWSAEDEIVTGHFGVYSGCVWGDDTSWKLRHVDLSRISDGIVTCDDRFGYVELPGNLPLREAVSFSPEADGWFVAAQLAFDRTTGKASAWVRDAIAFAPAEEPPSEPSAAEVAAAAAALAAAGAGDSSSLDLNGPDITDVARQVLVAARAAGG